LECWGLPWLDGGVAGRLVERALLSGFGSIPVMESHKIIRNAVGTKFVANKPFIHAPSHDAYRVEDKRFVAIGASCRQNFARGCGHGLLQKGRGRKTYPFKKRSMFGNDAPNIQAQINSICLPGGRFDLWVNRRCVTDFGGLRVVMRLR
jgi:hypothetical protein